MLRIANRRQLPNPGVLDPARFRWIRMVDASVAYLILVDGFPLVIYGRLLTSQRHGIRQQRRKRLHAVELVANQRLSLPTQVGSIFDVR